MMEWGTQTPTLMKRGMQTPTLMKWGMLQPAIMTRGKCQQCLPLYAISTWNTLTLSTPTRKPSLWLRYMDDTFVKIHQYDVGYFTKHMNRIDTQTRVNLRLIANYHSWTCVCTCWRTEVPRSRSTTSPHTWTNTLNFSLLTGPQTASFSRRTARLEA